MEKLRDYYYIDEDRVRSLCDQIQDRHIVEKNSAWTMGAALTGPKIETSRSSSRRDRNNHELVQLLIEHLSKTKDLLRARPQTVAAAPCASGPRFVLETTTASKMILPATSLTTVGGLKSLAVWISNPDVSVRPADEWDYVGSFLFLLETHWDESVFDTTYSGCSALQAVVNASAGRELVYRPKWPPGEDGYVIESAIEPLGRGSLEHPIQKLQRLGATLSDRRAITTLYRLRYMTNEQCIEVDGKERRCNDILGYPLFIAGA